MASPNPVSSIPWPATTAAATYSYQTYNIQAEVYTLAIAGIKLEPRS